MQAKRMRRSMLPLLLAGLLCVAGCAGVAPGNLKVPAQHASLLLKDPIQYDTESLFGKKATQVTIAAGRYNPVGQDDAGVFYRGPSHFFTSVRFENGKQETDDGGIYVPTNAAQPARLFLVVGSASTSKPLPPNFGTNDVVQHTLSGGAAGGIGAAIGVGIVMALSDSEKGRFSPVNNRFQPPGNVLREALVEAPATVAADTSSNEAHVGATQMQSVRVTGNDTYTAEKVAKAKLCSESPLATLTSKGAGFEEYTVTCASGVQMKLRCEFGNCQASE